MTIEIEGNFPETKRVITGFYSLDRAFIGVPNDVGETKLGVPIGHGYEIFGVNHVGKSSFTYSLAGIIAREQKENIALCDFEGFDPLLLTRLLEGVDYSGKVKAIREEKDEDQLAEMVHLLNKDCAVGILDSIGAISPISEQAGDLGEANMGRRAFILAQFVRKALHVFRFSKVPRTILMVNHWYPKIGTRGYDSPGGESKKFLASVRILLKREEEFPDGSYVLKGEVKKNRWGYKDREFHVFMLVGKGLHTGLTAMWDGMMLGKVSRKTVVKIGDENMGRLAEIVKKAKAGETEFFDPFFEILKSHETEDITDEEEVVEDDEE